MSTPWCVHVYVRARALCRSNGLEGQSVLVILRFCICEAVYLLVFICNSKSVPGAFTVFRGHVQRGLTWLCVLVSALLPRRPEGGDTGGWAVRCQKLLARWAGFESFL